VLFTAIIAVVCVAAVGLGAIFGLKYAAQRGLVPVDSRITGREYSAALVVVAALVVPLVMWIGNSMAIANALTYDELRSGGEQRYLDHAVQCYAGHSGDSASDGRSNCEDTYISGSYTYPEEYTEYYSCTDSNGKSSTCSRQACCHYPSADIYSPYATVEHTYEVTWYIYNRHGSHHYRGVYLDANPTRAGPLAIPGRYARGAPPDWLDAKAHIDRGDPRPVTDMFTYKNYILASHDKMLAPFSNDVDRYLKQGILPDHTDNILKNPIYGSGRPLAKKLSFVGVKVANEDQLQDALMYDNAAIGSKLQGDLHVVIIDSKLVDDPHKYKNALRAYWLGDHYGKRALAKNGIILVIGTSDGATIDWAQADTGMPFGNNVMVQALQNDLPGKTLEAAAIFGHPSTTIKPATKPDAKDDVKVTLSEPKSVIEDVMFGPNGFDRPCMECKNGKGVGYKRLVDKIQPSGTAKFVMILVVVLLSLPFWWGVAVSSFLERKRDSEDESDDQPGSREDPIKPDRITNKWRTVL
jgi:uncharacterized membrane protein YgcG